MGGVAAYTRLVGRGLSDAGEDVHVWCPEDGKGVPGDRFAVHADLGRFRATDLAHAGRLLDRFPGPRRLFVQWVPHGYGFRAMNVRFCWWLLNRARQGDQIELMVHEPFFAFWEGTWKQTAAAAVHRLMTILLLQAGQRVWVSIPAWTSMWKPYALGRPVPFRWLPIPSSLQPPDSHEVARLRARFGAEGRSLVGHLGTYGSLVGALLGPALAEVLRQPNPPRVVLMGLGSENFRRAFRDRYPEQAESVTATGSLSDSDLATYVAACDLLIQPYPDGISSRRTSAMAGLSLGIPVVTTRGRLSELLWGESGGVRLSEVGRSQEMAAQVMELLRHEDTRRQLGEAGRALYERTFSVSRTIDALRSVGAERAA